VSTAGLKSSISEILPISSKLLTVTGTTTNPPTGGLYKCDATVTGAFWENEPSMRKNRNPVSIGFSGFIEK
jgi:hypothetical protein